MTTDKPVEQNLQSTRAMLAIKRKMLAERSVTFVEMDDPKVELLRTEIQFLEGIEQGLLKLQQSPYPPARPANG